MSYAKENAGAVLPRADERWVGRHDAHAAAMINATMLHKGNVYVDFTEEPLLITREWHLVTFLRRYKPAVGT